MGFVGVCGWCVEVCVVCGGAGWRERGERREKVEEEKGGRKAS